MRQYISGWIERISLRRPEFNGLPACPYAQKARLSTCTIEDAHDLQALLAVIALPPWHVLVIRINDPIGLQRILSEQNEPLASRDLVALVSNPQQPVVVAGYQTTQTEYTLVILQGRQELLNASQQLSERGYYQNWDTRSGEYYAHELTSVHRIGGHD